MLAWLLYRLLRPFEKHYVITDVTVGKHRTHIVYKDCNAVEHLITVRSPYDLSGYSLLTHELTFARIDCWFFSICNVYARKRLRIIYIK